MGRMKEKQMDIDETIKGLTAEQRAYMAGFAAAMAVDHALNNPGDEIPIIPTEHIQDFVELYHEGNTIAITGWNLMLEYFRDKLEREIKS